jgi:hypothetical protein
MKHWGDEIHTNTDEWLCHSHGLFGPNCFPVNANLRELVECFLELLTIEFSLVCHVPLAKRPFRGQITDLIGAGIKYEISLVGASALLVDYAHGLGNQPDALTHCIIYPLRCQATLILSNPYGVCGLLADSNTSDLGPDGDMLSRNLDCNSICGY